MSYKEYITAYEKTKFSTLSNTSSHEIVRELMFQLSNYLQKIAFDINDYSTSPAKFQNTSKKEKALKKSKNMSKCLSIIYGLQTALDFDKAPEIAENLFQLYEFARQKLMEDLSTNKAEGTIQAIHCLADIRDAWEEMGKQNVEYG